MKPALVAALLVAPLLLPLASAGGAGLALLGPTDSVSLVAGEAAGIPLRVHVTISDAVCGGDGDLHVRLAAYGPPGGEASLPSDVVVHVPAGGYLSTPFEADADATMMLTVADAAPGRVQVMAGYDLPSSCVTTGEKTAAAKMQVRYTAAASAAPPPAPIEAAPPAAPPEPAQGEANTIRAPGPNILVWALGIGVIGFLFWVLGRSGRRQAGGRDELP